jgi:hypothetical protein
MIAMETEPMSSTWRPCGRQMGSNPADVYQGNNGPAILREVAGIARACAQRDQGGEALLAGGPALPVEEM